MESSSKPAAKPAAKVEATLKPGDAEAPGPITASHESGSWEQTAKVDEARQALLDAHKAES